MYGIQDKINQILRGQETIRKNQSMQPLQSVNSTTTFFAAKEPEEKTNEVARLRELLLKASKTELPHTDSMSTSTDNLQMTTNNDNEVARLREENENLRGTLKSFVLVSPIEAERMEKMEQDYDRLREEANNWHQHYRDEASKAQKCKQAYIEKDNEVARLRELLERAIEIAEALGSELHFPEFAKEIEAMKSEIAP